MTSAMVRTRLGLSLVCIHFALLALVGVLAAVDRFTQEELFLVVGLLGPLFATYTSAIVRRLLAESDGEGSEIVNRSKMLLAFGIPLFFCVVVLSTVLWKAFGALGIDSFVKLVGLTETLLGAYVGLVVEKFFGPLGPATSKAATTVQPSASTRINA